MTYIEFFTTAAVENICACLTNAPERVVLIGDKLKLMKRHAQRYQELFAQRGHRIEFVCRTVNKNNLQSIVDSLCWIVENFGDCAFGLTGGEDLYLVAMGIVYERFRNKGVKMHRFNIRNGTVIDCDQDGVTIAENREPVLRIEENIRLYGGDVIFEDVEPGTTVRWDMNEEFAADIKKMWQICKAYKVKRWNTQINVFASAEEMAGLNEGLTTVANVRHLKTRLLHTGEDMVFHRDIVEALYDSKLLTDYFYDENELRLTYKNPQVKRCLTKAGQALEMIVYLAALQAKDEQGPVYHDVLNGVCIDWDGVISQEQGTYDTRNEIDVMMMHGSVPVFVSCKNGFVKIDELYKLSAVAEQFGGCYAKKVLVASALDTLGNHAEYIRNRAADMGIRLIDDVQTMDEQELQRVVKSFWCN